MRKREKEKHEEWKGGKLFIHRQYDYVENPKGSTQIPRDSPVRINSEFIKVTRYKVSIQNQLYFYYTINKWKLLKYC